MIQQEINLNMIPHSSPVIVRVDQYDTGTGRIVAHLYDGDTPYTPGAGATAKIQGTKPDKKGFEYNATISTNTVTADLEQQMSCVYGPVRCQFVVTEASGRTGTFAFILSVQQSALEDDTDISETVLPDIIDAAEHNADRAEAAADRAEAASLHYPYIGANKNWYEWNPATEQYIDTGIKAEGSVYNAGLGIDITGDVISVDTDNTPTDGSMKPITSNAVYDGLALKQDNLTAGSFIDITSNVISATYTDATQNDSGLMSAADKTKLDGIESGAEVNVQADWNEADNTKDDYIKNKPTLGTAAAKDSTNAVTSGSTDLVESGAVKTAIDTAISAVYKPAGTKTCAELTSSLLVAANNGNVYNMTDSGTTTSDFLDGADHPINAGDNVGICEPSTGVYKFDLLSGFIDTSGFQTKNLTTAVESQSTVEGALGALSSNKQPKTLSSPITVDGTSETTVEGTLSAINTLAAANKTNKQDKTLSSAIESQSTVEGALSALSSNKQPKTLSTSITVDGTSETTVEGALGAINDLAAANKTAIGNLGTAAAKDATDTIASGSTDLIESGAVYTALNGKQDTLSAGTGIDISSNTVSVDADATPTDGSNKPVTSNGVYDALALKQNSLTFDNTPTDGSNNPVTSDGIYEALALKQDTLSAGTGINITSNTVSIDADATPTDGSNKPVTSNGVYDALALKQDVLTFDNTPTQDSNNPVKSGGVYTALQAKQNDLGLYIDDDGYICQD